MLKICVLFLASYLCYTAALPPCTCGRNLAPVCGSDGVTYSNQCRLDCEKSKGRAELHVVKHGPCDGQGSNTPAENLCICTLEYRPVCGTDGQTYPNSCALDCEKVKSPKLEKKIDGKCPDGEDAVLSVLPVCKPCARNIKPVCGTDGVSYNNECALNCAAAEQKREIKVAREGRCDQPKLDGGFDDSECECTREMILVCGRNGVTYSNKCIMKCAGVEEEKQGSC